MAAVADCDLDLLILVAGVRGDAFLLSWVLGDLGATEAGEIKNQRYSSGVQMTTPGGC